MLETLQQIWHYVAAGLTVIIAVLSSGHAVLYKRDSRATVAWVGFIWLVPVVGAILYLLLGVNRIRRRAVLLRGGLERYQTEPSAPPVTPQTVEHLLPSEVTHLSILTRLVDKLLPRPLLPGNRIEPLVNGDNAFPAMLRAIRSAKRSVTLSTYIFDSGLVGQSFVQALIDAVRRGVEVRVIVDDTGARYSFPSILPKLRRGRVPVVRFLPTFAPTRFLAINMRNHRKVLVADGRIGFTGGMNIRGGHLLKENPRHPIQDIHFQVEGPVVAHLQETFADDWFFSTGEALRGDTWFPLLESKGDMAARGISDGPDEDFEKLRWTILGALSCAQSSVKILTPYFLPDQSLISALNLAAMRGVQVDIILPEKNNLPFVQWACFAILWQVLEHDCRVWLTPPPFDHSKLMLVDGHWALIGSANWDPRSLRLNFEFNLECYGQPLAGELDQLVREKLAAAQRLTKEQVDGRSLPIQLRDGVARLLSPFL
jgi:cardiolipin synthase